VGAHWGNKRQEPCFLDTRSFRHPQSEANLSHQHAKSNLSQKEIYLSYLPADSS
jgi:hypothetical protein